MLTAEQKVLRKSHLGASDVPALFGLDPFKSAVDVWYSKTCDIDEKSNVNENIAMGNSFEGPLLEWAAEELGVQISTKPDDLYAVCPENNIFSATLDALIIPKTTKEAIEAKVSSRGDEWGDEEHGDLIPDRTNLQVQAQCLCHGLDRVHVVALLNKMGLKRSLYRVERNEAIIKIILQKGTEFWNKYVLTKTIPPESEYGLGSIEIIKRVIRTPQTWAEVPDELIEAWDNARVARLNAEKVEKEALERMLTPLGDAEGAQMKDGRTLMYLPMVKNILDQKRLKSEYPEIYDSMLKESVSRTPRIKGA